MAFMPQFMDPVDPSPMRQFTLLSGVFMAMTFGVFVLYGFAAHAFRERVAGSARVRDALRRGFALAFAMMAGKLAWSTR
jgi:threonine/homoserine/homoserine lactone efflux protein